MTAAWAWGLFVVGNAAWITPLDLWFHFTHRHTMTRQMHDWGTNPAVVQFLIPVSVALVVWFIVHEIVYHSSGP